jgi:branched-chain amino acid transport system substrate-binding protein
LRCCSSPPLEASLNVDWYTYNAFNAGGPTAIKQSNIPDRVFAIVEGVPNDEMADAQKVESEFRAKFGVALWYPHVVNEMRIAQAIKDAKSDEPREVAAKLEGMNFTTFMGGEGYIRKDDHQFFQDMYIANFGPMPAGAKFDEEKPAGAGKRRVSSRRRTPSCRQPARWIAHSDPESAGWPALRRTVRQGSCSKSSAVRG